MPNSIALREAYVPILDEVYQNASLTAVLDGPADLVRESQNANELNIPKLSMDGLADYSRNGGYVTGDVTLAYETVQINFDRGRMFQVDTLDNEETAGIAFGRLAGEFIRTKVVPELDAFRLATYASATGIGSATGTLSATNIVAAIRTGLDAMDEGEVPYDERYLFITPSLYNVIADMDTTKSRAILDDIARVIKVPQRRMYTKITQYDGTSTGETAGGYVKDATDGKDINFLIVHKPAVIQFQKHIAPKIISPEANQDADAWKFGYRNVGYCDVYDNKVAGVYVHHKA